MEDNDPDQLRSIGGTIYMLQGWIENAQDEVTQKLKYGIGKDYFPALCCLNIQLRAYVQDYPEILATFEAEEERLNNLYGGSPVKRKCELYVRESEPRLKNTLRLARDLGPAKIDTKYAYYPDMQPDDIDFSEWGED